MNGLVEARLRAQHLSGAGFEKATDALRWFGAVQSQDYPAAKWALGLRVKRATEAGIDAAYDAGDILRTHVLRPTWHFVLPSDIRWMLKLSAPKISLGLSSRYRELELDSRTITRAHHVFARVLAGGRHMTRAELGAALRGAGVAPDGQRLPHLLSSGELAGLLTSGPRIGKQHSYALLEERAAPAPPLDGDEAIGELTRRYFISHGPAQVRDFVWWSGLTGVEARRGIDIARDSLSRREVDGVEYWLDARQRWPRSSARTAHLLPNFDEYSVGYTDRSAMLHPERPFRPELFAFASVLANIAVIGGRLCGAWRRVAGRGAGSELTVEIKLLTRLSAPETALLEQAGRRLSHFIDRPVRLAWHQ